MKPDQQKLDRLLEIVAQTLGCNPRTPTDFVYLASDIHRVTGRTIGLSTLKRLWGYIKDQSGTTYSTLSLLSKYAGYNDWDAFCHYAQVITEESESGFSTDSLIESRLLPIGSRIKVQLGHSKSCNIEKIDNPDLFTITASENIKLHTNDRLRVACLAIGRPFYATDCRRESQPLGSYTGARSAGILSIVTSIGSDTHCQ